MINRINSRRLAKFGFFTLLAATAIFLLKSALILQDKEPNAATSFYLKDKFSDDYTNGMVRSNFHDCIIQPSKTFCFEPGKSEVLYGGESLHFFRENKTFPANFTANSNNSSLDGSSRRLHPIHATYMAFARLCKKLHIKPVLIEPSVVFCMLTQESKTLLMKRRFNISAWTGGGNVLTFAINESESSKLSDYEMKGKLGEFKHWSINMEESDRTQNVSPARQSNLKTHHFLVRRRIIIHVVVFYNRNRYLWHGGISMLPNEVLNFTPKENLLYSGYEAIYERFVPIEISSQPVLEAIYIPSDPRLFLHQMESSQVLYCNSSNAFYANKTKERKHGHMSHERFVQLTFIALEEMKAQLYPELITFWIVGGTLLGWYRECSIIPYTTDVDFAAWAVDIDNADSTQLTRKFIKNENLRLKEVMGLPEEALEFMLLSSGLRVDLFFMYEELERYWVSGHRPSQGYYFPYYYPKFTLCSADLHGHKVQVPCNTLDIIVTDYGAEWDKPISDWHYEIHPKNMGKRRYWYKEEKAAAYIVY